MLGCRAKPRQDSAMQGGKFPVDLSTVMEGGMSKCGQNA